MCHITFKNESHWLLWNLRSVTSLTRLNLIGGCGISNVPHHLQEWISLVVVECRKCRHITHKIESHWMLWKCPKCHITREIESYWLLWNRKCATSLTRLNFIGCCEMSNVPHHSQELISLVLVERQMCHITCEIESHWLLWNLKSVTSLARLNLIGFHVSINQMFELLWLNLNAVNINDLCM